MSRLVYIIEDDPMTQVLLKTMLIQSGIEVMIFSDYQSALSEIEIASESKFPIAVFSDFMLPNGDGLDFLNQLREKFSSDQLPFYFITGVQKEMIEPFVDKYEYREIINKPIESEKFQKIVNTLKEAR